ncbi:uncharacterized protein HaLaN_15587 [Haematococcus lacustris]|uniref:CFA20 domain-containing protein n=1 Tax=Haematococcus lacustris TaxID=44745 RepID=A0A699ZI45_HAELA|nr:uncharacterized protein HaLaN_15587 [Haematococcus lacustris]
MLQARVKVTPVKVFVIHLEVQTQDQNVHRISISSMYRTESLQRKSNGIQIPFTQSSHRWCIMAVDLVTALRKYTTSPLSCLRSAQLCSWLTLRALFTSDLKFSLQTLPRDMALSHALDSSLFEFVWLPQEPLDVGCADVMPVSRRMTADKRPSSSSSAGEFARSLVWPPHSDELVFTASSVIVAMAAQAGGAQRFFLGHTAPVVALAFDGEGRLMASAQDGRQAVIRVWDFRSRQCLAILNGHASGMLGLDVSADGRALLGVGQDSACRQLIVLWDISHLRSGGKPTVLAQSTTEYNIKVARFSAYEEDHLVTAGRDNVRMYRLKAGQLRGVTVRTGAPSKQASDHCCVAATVELHL